MEKLIREAGSWAERLGLEPEVVECHGWKESAGTVLVLSHDPALDRLLRTRFPRVRGKEQTDLFLDTAPARAVTKLADALAAGDASGAREGLADLDRLDPGHRRGDNARTLIDALGLPPPIDTGEGHERLKKMEREWRRRHPICWGAAPGISWCRSGGTSAGPWRAGNTIRCTRLPCFPGVPGRPRLGGGEALGTCRTRIRPGPDLLARLAEACWRLRDRAGAIEAWLLPVKFTR